MVGGQLHNEGCGVAGEELGLLQDDTGNDDGGDAQEVSRGGDPGRAAEDSAGDHGDEGSLRAAGDEGSGHDGHTTVALVLDGTGSHDAGNAAAHAHQDRDEALTRQAELTEHAVQNEGDTGHVAASLQERQQQEQHQHLRHKAQNRADASHDTIQNQAAEPLGAADLLQTVADEHRDAGNPHAVSGSVGSAVAFLVLGVQVLIHRANQLRLGGAVNVGFFQRLFVFQHVGHAGVFRRGFYQGFQSGLGAFVGIILVFQVDGGGHFLVAVFIHEGGDDGVAVAVIFGGRLIIAGSDAEQVPAVSEESVVGPVRGGGAHRAPWRCNTPGT